MNSINLEVVNGHWSVNQKPLTQCSKEKKEIFLLHLRMKKFKSPIQQKSQLSFKQKSDQVKRMYNHKFANFRHEKQTINISNKELIFERKK